MRISPQQYAQVLFSSLDSEEVLAVKAQLEEIEPAKKILQNPQISQDEKIAFFQELGLNQKLINFLLLLTQQKNLAQLKTITGYFQQLYLQKNNLLEVEVTSSQELSEQEQQDLIAKLSQKYQQKIILQPKIDPTILGGLVLKIGDEYWDGSVRNKLEQLKITLIR